MSDARWERIKAIFRTALATAEADRRRLLDRECFGDDELRREVESLLAANAPGPLATGAALDALDARDSGTSTVATAPLVERPGTKIGPYKLLQQIGEGGFGVVFMAEQDVPVRRRVALKVIKLGMDTRQVVARFEQERQALALMDHPHIAKVLDAGATPLTDGGGGRPFFVMEYVIGDPITAFADAHKMNLRDRLGLFSQVCAAVQHAHTKGIIHRDLKPRNVLVSMVDGRPHAKVIDFGIAKATGARLTDKTLFTEHRQLIGTPEYMSPEQAEGSPDIDTRTDVYALGVLLYELLTGATPFDARRLRSAAFAEMQRIIKEEEPPMPSVRVMKQPAVSVDRAISPFERGVGPIADRTSETVGPVSNRSSAASALLAKSIRGELDWIVLKALEKDRARRYESPSQLAADVQRHLSGEPVIAAPPSMAYRVRKFVRKHRAAVTTGSMVAATFLLGMVGVFWQWNRANAFMLSEQLARSSNVLEVQRRESAEQQRDHAATLAQREVTFARANAYIANTGAAMLRIDRKEWREAEERLEGSPAEIRDWEWNYLSRVANNSNSRSTLLPRNDGDAYWSMSGDKALVYYSADEPGQLIVIDVNAMKIARELPVQFGPVTTAELCYRGRFVVAVLDYSRVQVIDTATGETVHSQQLPTHIWEILASPLAPIVALRATSDEYSGSDISFVYNLIDGEISRLTLPSDGCQEAEPLAFKHNSPDLLLRSEDGRLFEWNYNRAVFREIPVNLSVGINSANYSPSGALVALHCEDDFVRIIDASTGELCGDAISVSGMGFLPSTRWSSDGTMLAVGGEHGQVRLATSDGQIISHLFAGKRGIRSIRFSQDGGRFLAASSDGTVVLWSIPNWDDRVELTFGREDLRLADFCADGERIVALSGDGTVAHWTTATAATSRRHIVGDDWRSTGEWSWRTTVSVESRAAHRARLSDIGIPRACCGRVHEVFCGRGELVAQINDGLVQIVDRNGKPLGTLELDPAECLFDACDTAAGSRDGAVAALVDNKGRVHAFDVSFGRRVSVFTLPPRDDGTRRVPDRILLSSDGEFGYALADGSIFLWCTNSGQAVTEFHIGGSDRTSMALSPNGDKILVANSDVYVLNSTDLAVEHVVEGIGSADAVAMSVSGNRIAVARRDGAIEIVDLSGQLLLDMPGLEGPYRPVKAMQFATSDNALVVCFEFNAIVYPVR